MRPKCEQNKDSWKNRTIILNDLRAFSPAIDDKIERGENPMNFSLALVF